MTDEAVQHEVDTLRAYALRWAVLAAWQHDLQHRGIRAATDADGKLHASRTKLASGCFSACEVNCDLSAVETQLTSTEGSSAEPKLDHWLDLIGTVMSHPTDSDKLLTIPAIRFQYNACGAPGCRCED